LVSQFEHAVPCEPHAVSIVPAWHLPSASQHPPQFEGPHVGGGAPWHEPAEHPCPFDAQSSHFAPLEPHASDSVPNRQSPAAVQHPVQLEASHLGATPSHVPFAVHAKPTAPQSRHCAARWPHALRSVPA
jgi:hypothetical protein